MSSEYNYDTDAQFFPFFVLTISTLITVPLTLSLFRTPTDTSNLTKAGRIESPFQPPNADLIDVQRAKQKRKELRLKRMLAAAAGWVTIGYMVYLLSITSRSASTVWNPYDILDVSLSATEKQISSRYRKLSTTMHPDKRKPNAALNQTLETINDEWVEITKAYKALTDEDVRNNYIQYGNPDGKQSTSFGIALPQLLVAEGSGKFVLAFYGLLLGIGLPWLVGRWWYGMQKLTRERVLVTSAGSMFKEFKERMDGGDTLAAVSTAGEFQEVLGGSKADSGLSKIETRLNDTDVLSAKDQKILRDLEKPVRRKTLALAWAYLARLDLQDKTLEGEKFELAPLILQINEAFLSICLAYGFTAPVLSSYQLSQNIVQAVLPTPIGPAPLMQLPHFTTDAVSRIEASAGTERRSHLTVQEFMALPAQRRQALASSAGIPSASLNVAENVARRLPLLKIERTFFKVQGEKFIIPGSLVQLIVKARFIPPGTPAASIPALKDADLLDIDPAEGDLKAQKVEAEQNHVPLAFAPFLARNRAPKWHIFLADKKQGKIAVPPFSFTAFDKKPFDAEGKPTFVVVTLKAQFGAPPQVGAYKFQLHMICDSYIGFDEKVEVVMNIDDASKAQQVDDDDDISEPDEDTIAGQMAALKGQPTTTAEDAQKAAEKAERKLRRDAMRAKEIKDEESDYESGTDEDEGSSESATDTDTDSEAEDEKKKGAWW